jgi:pimeloyl-ACP methyl ester carboxylesterase
MVAPRERVVDVDGAALLVREWGESPAPPLLFWHGLAAGGSGLDAGPLADALGGRAHVVAPDSPGFGGSPRFPPERYLGGALATLARRLLDALRIERCAFVGESWGAWVGCHLAAAAPDRIRTLVLLDGGYTEPADWGSRLIRSVGLSDCVNLARDRGASDPEAWGAAFYATLQPPHVSSTYAAIATSRLSVLLLAAGEPADAASESGLERFRSSLPAADVQVVEGAGHDVFAVPSTPLLVAEWLAAQRGVA